MRSAEKFDGGVKETFFRGQSPIWISRFRSCWGCPRGNLAGCASTASAWDADKRLSFGSGAARSGARRLPRAGDLNGCAPAITPYSLPAQGWLPVAQWRSDRDQPAMGRCLERSQILSVLQECDLCVGLRTGAEAGGRMEHARSLEVFDRAANVAALQHPVETLMTIGPRQFG